MPTYKKYSDFDPAFEGEPINAAVKSIHYNDISQLGIFETSDECIKIIEWPELIDPKPKDRIDIFDVIEKHFLYDSSYVLYLNKYTKEEYYREKPFTLNKLKELPIVPKPFFYEKASQAGYQNVGFYLLQHQGYDIIEIKK